MPEDKLEEIISCTYHEDFGRMCNNVSQRFGKFPTQIYILPNVQECCLHQTGHDYLCKCATYYMCTNDIGKNAGIFFQHNISLRISCKNRFLTLPDHVYINMTPE